MFIRLCALTLAAGGLAAINVSEPPRAASVATPLVSSLLAPIALPITQPPATGPSWAAELPPGTIVPTSPNLITPSSPPLTPVGDLSASTSHSSDPNDGPAVNPFAGQAQDAAALLGATPPPGWQPPTRPDGLSQPSSWAAEEPADGGDIDPAACFDCLAGSLFENEPLCADGYIDATNGGCNSSPNVFGPVLECGDSICGTYGTFRSSTGGAFRDTDWYRVSLPVATTLTWSAVGAARTRVFVLSSACPTTTIATAVADPCQAATLTVNLAAGDYYLFVGTDLFSGVPCGSRYRATLSGTPCCDNSPRPGDRAENEPACSNGYIDATNGGCNFTPNVFGSIACGQTVAGTYGTFLNAQGGATRDTDWYTFTITQTSNVTWTVTGDAPTRVFIFNGVCPTSTVVTANGPACTPVTVTANNLAPGTYYAWAGTEVFSGVPCGSKYRGTLTVSTCCQTVPQAGDAIENEPDCGTAYIDATNGGCNSTPNVFGQIACGQTVAGRYGTFLSAAGGSVRDTDWYNFTLTQTSDVTFTCVGEAPTQILILNGSCPTGVLANVTGAACTPITATATGLAPGTYRVFVATSGFTGVPCGSRYRATLTATGCCAIAPIAGDSLEGEPNCTGAPTDPFNGGCNFSTPVFSTINCNQVMAGSYGAPSGIRDTDWYTFSIRQRGTVRWAAIGEAPTQLAIIAEACPPNLLANTTFAACIVGEINIVLNPGTYRAFIATSAFTGVSCPARYRCLLQSTVCGCPADHNGDTVVDLFDYLDFVSDFAANASAADYNGDTVIDFFDYLDFVAAFSADC